MRETVFRERPKLVLFAKMDTGELSTAVIYLTLAGIASTNTFKLIPLTAK